MKFNHHMKYPRFVIIAALLGGSLLPAQDAGDTGRQVRFLAVGDLPPFRQEIRDGVRYELEPPAGSIPPREVVLGFGDEDGDGGAVPLRLGQVSAPLAAPPGVGPLVLRRRDGGADPEPWLRLNRPETGDFLVLLCRDPREKSWESARSLVLPDGGEEAPAGSARYVNLSPQPVGIVTGGENVVLEPGKVLLRQVAAGVERPFEIMLPTGGGLRRLHAGVVVHSAGERSLILIYRADGVSPRRPLKVAVRREPAPPDVQVDPGAAR